MGSSNRTAWCFTALIGCIAIASSGAIPSHYDSKLSDLTAKRDIEDWATHQGCKFLSGDDLDSYSPYDDKSKCPGDDFQWIRPADSLSPGEQEYLAKRRPLLQKAWDKRMKDVGLKTPLPKGRLPIVAMALSGGGYRAMISGSGMAFQRNDTKGSVGDILAVSSYMAGLSGGSWAVASYITNNGRSPVDLANNVWNLESNLVLPSKNKFDFYKDLVCKSNVKEYQDKFETGVTDLWALALSEHLFPEQFHATKRPDLKWTEIPNRNPIVKDAAVPYPIVIALERSQPTREDRQVDLDDPIWEFTLTEFGTWKWGKEKKSQGAFTPIRWLGTKMENVGTSSALFNQGLAQKLKEGKSEEDLGLFAGEHNIKEDFIEEAYIFISEEKDDVAIYENPFLRWDAKENPVKDLEKLHLVDGGEAEENIPIDPFLQDSRHVDAIFAFDNSNDNNRWPDGRSLYNTYEKAKKQAHLYGGKVRMPPIPSPNGFLNSGMNTRPVFFGCDNQDVPTIIYVPNYSWSTASNTDTFKLDYARERTLAMIDNGRRALDLNGTVPNWDRCLTCAMIDNAILQAGQKRDENCQECFKEWCWDGKENKKEAGKVNNVVGTLPALPLSVPAMQDAIKLNEVIKDVIEGAPNAGKPGKLVEALSKAAEQKSG